ncbi:hypothetical protein [Staphylococcus phage SEP-1]|uniref:Uncharacterized protein n=1 Tax=Staphylococcus phage HS13 TaxID=3056403 RepID=A0AA50ADB9_9VIRU|nr:hypothetical protein [Staphylococcus phage Lacachita]WGL30804.1 hypothetical protein Southeast_025 [Staphylococcus phage Southeast]WLJ26077.1 MAG: hypothetical protein [Staphylococcus phage HS13]DAI53265.1 MAG TPA: hypothetical protein [Caudoviricetes sp.]
MTSIRTYKQASKYLKYMEGKAWNPDKAYGLIDSPYKTY